MTPEQMLVDIGNQIRESYIIMCPFCKTDKPEVHQQLSNIGDSEHILFCPHCDMMVELTMASLPNDYKVECDAHSRGEGI